MLLYNKLPEVMWRSKKQYYRYGFNFNIKVTKRRERRTARRSKGFYLVD